MAVVSVVQNSDPLLAVQEAISLLGGIEGFVRPNDKVLIKPNLVAGVPATTGLTTDPRIVQAIFEVCIGVRPKEVVIAEGSGAADTKLAFEKCRYKDLAQRHGIRLVDLNESQTTIVDLPECKALRELAVPTIVLESDVIINVPKFKLYGARSGRVGASLSVKNLLGALPGKGEFSTDPNPDFPLELSREWWTPEGRLFLPHHRRWWSPRGEKKRVHENIADGLVDLNTVIKPSLNVIDGIIACRDPSMSDTDPRPVVLNTVLAGRDPLAVDWIASSIGGLDPFDVSYLKRAAQRKIGESDYDRIQTVGTNLSRIKRTWKTEMNKYV